MLGYEKYPNILETDPEDLMEKLSELKKFQNVNSLYRKKN